MNNKFSLEKQLIKNNLVFLGDDHNMNLGRNWLNDQIRNLSNLDFLVVEYIETSKQYLIDNADYKKLEIYLKKNYKEFPGFSNESIINLLKTCKDKNIKVFGVDMPENSYKNWKSKKAQEERIKYITNQILQLSKNGKGIILLGADHVEKTGESVFSNIKKIKNNLVSIVFIGGKDWSIDTEEYWIRKLELNTIKDKTSNNFFYLKVLSGMYPTDWIIHFPQSESLLV